MVAKTKGWTKYRIYEESPSNKNKRGVLKFPVASINAAPKIMKEQAIPYINLVSRASLLPQDVVRETKNIIINSKSPENNT